MGLLTALDVSRATRPGMHPDGAGQVGIGGARSWIYRFTLHGKQRYLGLGSTNAVPLKRARELAAGARRLRAEGIDPVERRRSNRVAERIATAKKTTFAQCANQYLAAHEAGWRNPKHRQQWHNTLAAPAGTRVAPGPINRHGARSESSRAHPEGEAGDREPSTRTY